MLLLLKPGITYGPVNSRRLGRSMGINLMPGTFKLCSFNCIYCHYGWTRIITTDMEPYRDDLPTRTEVVAAVEKALCSSDDFEYITFSGNGEPTLHPDFPELVNDIGQLRDKYRPQVKIGLLSNSTGLERESVRASISGIDFPMFKLDAGIETTFRIINRPAKGVDFHAIVERLSGLSGILIQTVLIDGTPNNTSDEELDAYFALLGRIHPREVHIYSIDRPVPQTDIRLVPPERLRQIADEGRQKTGIEIKAFYPR